MLDERIGPQDQYKTAVIELFRGGTATDEQWEEMAEVVLSISEDPTEYFPHGVPLIDDVIYGPRRECPACGEICRPPECWNCGEPIKLKSAEGGSK